MELEEFALVASRAGIGYLTTAEGDIPLGPNADMLVARIKGAVAAEESRKIGVRVRRKKVELAEKGKPAGGGVRAFGYNWPVRIKGTGGRERIVVPDGDAKPYSVYEPEARAIRWAYDHLLNEGGTIAGCQREWIAADCPLFGVGSVPMARLPGSARRSGPFSSARASPLCANTGARSSETADWKPIVPRALVGGHARPTE